MANETYQTAGLQPNKDGDAAHVANASWQAAGLVPVYVPAGWSDEAAMVSQSCFV